MDGINIAEWIAIAATILLELATTTVFLYQRTLRKLAFNLETNQSSLAFLYPRYMLRIYMVSFLRWPLYIYLVFTNWVAAATIFASSLVLKVMMPVRDRKHLLKMRTILKKKFRKIPNEAYASILSMIDSGLLLTGYDPSTMEECEIISRHIGDDDSDYAMMEIGNRVVKENPSLFEDVSQAIIHIPVVKVVMGRNIKPKESNSSHEGKGLYDDLPMPKVAAAVGWLTCSIVCLCAVLAGKAIVSVFVDWSIKIRISDIVIAIIAGTVFHFTCLKKRGT